VILLRKKLKAALAAIDKDDPKALALALSAGRGIPAWTVALDGDGPLLISTAHADALECSKLLLSMGAPIDAANDDGFTALLIAAGADMEPPNSLVMSPMGLAAEGGHLPCIRMLLDSGFPVDSRDIDEWTPAMHAARQDHAEALALLLDSGADMCARNDRRRSLLTIAADHGCFDSVCAIIARARPELIDRLGIEQAIFLGRHSAEPRCAGIIESFAASVRESSELSLHTPAAQPSSSKRPAL
jgi:ankyrin repeat protein